MRFLNTVRPLAFASLLGLVGACGESEPMMTDCPAPSAQSQNAVMVPLDLQAVAGSEAFALNKTVTLAGGFPFKASKFRYYLSSPKLVDASGRTVDAQLVSRDGRTLPYGVALVDAGKPGSEAIALMAEPGEYKAVEFMIGVPDSCATGEELNHGDASARAYPLDVDADMYWSWDPGYIHLKIEGQVQVDGKWKSLFFHVGDDQRRPRVRVEMPISIAKNTHSHLPVAVDVARLFVNEQGANVPDLKKEQKSHGGAPTDRIAENIARSGVFTPGTVPAH